MHILPNRGTGTGTNVPRTSLPCSPRHSNSTGRWFTEEAFGANHPLVYYRSGGGSTGLRQVRPPLLSHRYYFDKRDWHEDTSGLLVKCKRISLEAVDRICREYSAVIGQMELDTTSWQVLNTTESVSGQILTINNCFDIESFNNCFDME